MICTEKITLWLDDGRRSIEIDKETFELLKMTIKEKEAKRLRDLKPIIDDLVKEGYTRSRAIDMCILAKKEVYGTH